MPSFHTTDTLDSSTRKLITQGVTLLNTIHSYMMLCKMTIQSKTLPSNVSMIRADKVNM